MEQCKINRADTLLFDPLYSILGVSDEALRYFARRDLLEESIPPVETLWKLSEAVNLVKKQHPSGCWKYPGKPVEAETWENYSLLETFRSLRVLVEQYEMNRGHPSIKLAADYLFSCQTEEGDIRGILGNQSMPYYHGAILELLIKAGYAQDERIIRGLDWLLHVRQEDGGWLIPTQTVPSKQRTNEFWSGKTFQADWRLPHSHMATGMALRAFAAHPDYNLRPEAVLAGEGLKERLFQPDRYRDRKTPEYWLKLQFPFWWTSLLTALDTLSRIGFQREDPAIARGLDWFLNHQETDGLWPTGYGSGGKAEANRRWVGLAVCRVLKALNKT